MGSREARRRHQLWPTTFLAVAAAMLGLSALLVFQSRDLVPWIFGGVWALVGILEIVRRRLQGRPGEALLAVGIACAILAPAAQIEALRIDARRTEGRALAALAGHSAPELRAAHLLNGEAFPAAPQELTVVNFWATWCPPCIEELPLLEAFSEKHRADALRTVGATALYGSSPDKELEGIDRFLAEHGVRYPNLVSADGELLKAFHVRSLPTTILLDRGQVVAYRIGIAGTRQVLAEAERRLGTRTGGDAGGAR